MTTEKEEMMRLSTTKAQAKSMLTLVSWLFFTLANFELQSIGSESSKEVNGDLGLWQKKKPMIDNC